MQTGDGLLVPLALLGRLPATRRAEPVVAVAADAARARAVHLGSHVEKHSTHLGGVGRDAVLLRKLVVGLLALGCDHATVVAAIHAIHWLVHVRISRLSEDAHDHGTKAASTLVLGKVVAARDILTTVAALEGLVSKGLSWVWTTTTTTKTTKTTTTTVTTTTSRSRVWVSRLSCEVANCSRRDSWVQVLAGVAWARTRAWGFCSCGAFQAASKRAAGAFQR